MQRLLIVLPLIVVALVPAATAGGAVPQSYVVVLETKANPDAVAAQHAQQFGVELGFVYRHARKGYSAVVPAAALDDLRADSRVAYVERDATVRATAMQSGATWGLDRIDQRALPLSTTYTYTATGSGLGGGKSTALEQAVSNSIADGVTYAVAAGNETEDACTGSPSGLAAAITVGSTTNTDARSSFSDFGPCVDFFAPDSNITSASFLTDTGTATMSGTSMASPHVAGAAALYLQGTPSATPAQVRDGLFNLTTKNVVTDAQSANNHLLLSNL